MSENVWSYIPPNMIIWLLDITREKLLLCFRLPEICTFLQALVINDNPYTDSGDCYRVCPPTTNI